MFVVFDLDGTIALCDHRRHFVQCDPGDRDYRSFYAACVDDSPCQPVIDTLRAHYDAGHRVEIWSGRSSEVELETRQWLSSAGLDPALLTRMRPAGVRTQDVVLKRGWLNEARELGDAPDLVYDDRDSVVAMWRREGLTCFQVALGEF